MSALLRSETMTETRGQIARRRRMALRVSRDKVAAEAGVSVKTVKSYEEDAHAKPLTGQAIEDALTHLEQQAGAPAQANRRASDSPRRRIIDAALGDGDEGEVQVRIFDDGVRAIFLLPPGATPPSDEEVRRAIREARGE